MKKGLILIFSVLTLVGCKEVKKAEGEVNASETVTTSQIEEGVDVQDGKQAPQIGGEKDNHGCLASAGETWSELKQKCLRLFEEGLRLNPVKVEGSAVISAFVIVDDTKSKAEIFLPEESSKALILEKKSEGIYADSTYKYDAKEGVLYINNIKQYSK